MSRLRAYGVSLTLVALTLSAALRAPRDDSYPLSTYPMFGGDRGRPLLYFAEGLDAHGVTARLPPEALGTSEVMQAVVSVRKAVQAGKRSRRRFCREIAARVADLKLTSSSGGALRRVQLVGARFDPVQYFVAGPEPLEREVHARCKVRSL